MISTGPDKALNGRRLTAKTIAKDLIPRMLAGLRLQTAMSILPCISSMG